MGLDLAPSAGAFFLLCALELLYLIVPLVALQLNDRKWRDQLRMRLFNPGRDIRHRIIDVSAGMVLGFMFYFLSDFMNVSIYRIVVKLKGVEFYEQASEGIINTMPPYMSKLELAFAVILTYLTIALSEEFFYRGIIMREISHKNKIAAVLISSFLFALYHVIPGLVPWITFLTFWPYYFVFGLALGGLVLLNKGDLLMAIISHGTFDAILLVIQFG